MRKVSFLKRLALVAVILFLSTTAYGGTSLIVNYGDINTDTETLILKGNNFDAFGQPIVMVGDTVLQNCLISTTEITCSIAGTPVTDKGSWKATVSAGNSPHANSEIDVFSRSELVVHACLSGDIVECYSNDPATRNVGLCQVGYRICNNDGTWSDCIGETGPQVELCFTGSDEDCDGFAGFQDFDCATACGELTECGTDDCVDILTDINNCGACGEVCSSNEACVEGVCQVDYIPDCSGKECGDDGYGGSCGTCGASDVCSADGQCISSDFCNDGLVCTEDVFDGSGGCINSIQGGSCVIAGVCYVDGQMNPDNSCQSCDSAQSQTSWSQIASGLACGDQSSTVCTNPDTCDGSGVCLSNNLPSSVECRSAINICDISEVCDGSGNCPTDSYANAGTVCGTNSICTGSGVCVTSP